MAQGFVQTRGALERYVGRSARPQERENLSIAGKRGGNVPPVRSLAPETFSSEHG